MGARGGLLAAASATIALAGAMGGVSGCADPGKEVSFEAQDPAARIRAIKQAARTEDRAAIPDLIQALDSEDPMQRLLAIRTLEKMTGQTLGYEHEAPWWQRDEAVQRWVEWAREQGLAAPARSADELSAGAGPAEAPEGAGVGAGGAGGAADAAAEGEPGRP